MDDRTPREIEYENEVIDMDYLQEKFDEDESVIPKEIDEEIDLLTNLQINKGKEPPPKIIKEDIATLKAKVKRKQQKNISHLSEDQPTADGAKEDTLPIVTKTISSSARAKNHPSSDHYPHSHPSDSNHSSGAPEHREKSSQETKLPHLPTQRNKPLPTAPGSQKKSLFKKKSNDSVAPIASEEKDSLKSMEILKRREEEILRAKTKREKLLQEQAEYLPASEFEPMLAMPSSSKKTKKKKEVKEVSLFSPPLPYLDSSW